MTGMQRGCDGCDMDVTGCDADVLGIRRGIVDEGRGKGAGKLEGASIGDVVFLPDNRGCGGGVGKPRDNRTKGTGSDELPCEGGVNGGALLARF